MSTQDSVTAMVRYAIAARGESQAVVASVLGIAQSGVNDRMKGRVPWRVDELDRLAEHFGLTVADLVAPPLPSIRPVATKPAVAVRGRGRLSDVRGRGAVTRKYPRRHLRVVRLGHAA